LRLLRLPHRRKPRRYLLPIQRPQWLPRHLPHLPHLQPRQPNARMLISPR
jgi:hypothetical protein